MIIQEYFYVIYFNYVLKSECKFFLNKCEFKKFEKEVKNFGLMIVLLLFFINEKGFVKIEIVLVKGKKEFDKCEVIKE